MPVTTVRGPQVRDGTIQRLDLDAATVGAAVIRKLLQGAGIALSSTGADAGTGDVTVAIDTSVDLGLAAAQSIDFTDAGTANVPNVLALGHDSSLTPLANFGGAVLFTGKSDTTLGRTMGDLSWLWTVPTDATRSAKLRLRAVNAAAFVNSLTLFPSGAASFNSTVDPGVAGIVNANTGFRIGNVDLSVDHLATTTTNDNAAAGEVGETIGSFITSASAVTYTTAQTKNLTSISLTAGDWDVRGSLGFNFTTFPASTFFNFIGNIGTTTGVVSDTGGQVAVGLASPASTISGIACCALSPRRISLASTTTVYLVGKAAAFASGSCTGFGFIEARRIR
jgi:hypothetical protein